LEEYLRDSCHATNQVTNITIGIIANNYLTQLNMKSIKVIQYFSNVLQLADDSLQK